MQKGVPFVFFDVGNARILISIILQHIKAFCNRASLFLSSIRLNQEKMKRHRETIIPQSEPKGPAPGVKGRVAATDVKGDAVILCILILTVELLILIILDVRFR